MISPKQQQYVFSLSSYDSVTVLLMSIQPRSQGLSLPAPKSERRETLVAAGHVIWVTNQNRREGCSSTKFCPPYNKYYLFRRLHCSALRHDRNATYRSGAATWKKCLFWWQHFTLSCRLSIDKSSLSRPPFNEFFVTTQILGGTWPAATRVSLLSLLGAGRERPWERGWWAFAIWQCVGLTTRLQ